VELADDTAHVVFDEPEVAVAPGQGAALYDGERLLGGGWIVRTEASR
jgi:tRNA-specific 2-thiouridylase